jgi:hypothetical protein
LHVSKTSITFEHVNKHINIKAMGQIMLIKGTSKIGWAEELPSTPLGHAIDVDTISNLSDVIMNIEARPLYETLCDMFGKNHFTPVSELTSLLESKLSKFA